MQKTLFIKLSIIATICCFFFIGLQLLSGLVWDRQENADMVVRQIAEQHVSPQQIITPFIAIPTTVEPHCTPQARASKSCAPNKTHIKTILASQTDNQQTLTVSDDTYQRSIYHAISYTGDIGFKQKFAIAPQNGTTFNQNARDNATPNDNVNNSNGNANDSNGNDASNSTSPTPLNPYDTVNTLTNSREIVHWGQAKLIIPISDLRGVAALPTVTINDKEVTAQYPVSAMLKGLSYIEVPLPAQYVRASEHNNPHLIDVNVSLPLAGISNISTIPTGQHYKLTMSSDWTAPNFGGQALPNTKAIQATGFSATWQNQYLALANNQRLRQCLNIANQHCMIDNSADLLMSTNSFDSPYASRNKDYFQQPISHQLEDAKATQHIKLNSFGVSFAEPNDVYLQTERTMKYALLLVLVSFGTFFLFEVVKSARIHPIQYLLVGAALLIFYVLLLPLAEQVPFWQAYSISAVACVGLIGWYTYYVLGSVKRAGIFTLLLSTLYAGFYGILSSEEMNLLMGAVFCFILLAGVMYVTRKVDWYQVA